MTDAPTSDTAEATTATASGVSPPYVSFGTFWTFVEDLAQRGPLPQVIEDAAISTVKSPGGKYEIVSALRFFGLMDKDRRPTTDPTGLAFLKSPSPETLRPLLEDKYRSIIALGLDTATAGQVDAALTEMGARNSVNKCRRFFVVAAQKAGIEVGHHLATAPTSSGTSRTRRPRQRKPADSTPAQTPAPEGEDLKTAYIKMLMDKASSKDDTDTDLLDRIEKMLGVS